MKVIIDTCSLLSLVRYYLPFDKQNNLLNFIRSKIEASELIIIDAVYKECQIIAKGIILDTLFYLKDKNFKKDNEVPVNTENIIAPSPAKFLRQVDNQFVIGIMKNRLSEAEYENRKEEFMRSADMRMILYYLNLKQQAESQPWQSSLFEEDTNRKDIIIVTEETQANNDGKLFHKIPKICEILNIPIMTLPELLTEYDVIDALFK